MATKNQIIANRQNAQRSTGPKTTQGKTTVSQNAVKHGLTAHRDVISFESQADFDLYRQNFLDELDPQGPTESMLAERLITLSWRLKRVNRIQTQTIDALNSPAPPTPLAKLTQSFLAKHLPPCSEQRRRADLPLGRMAVDDFANARVLDRLLMYERRIEHSLYKTILELQRLNLIRNTKRSAELDVFSTRSEA